MTRAFLKSNVEKVLGEDVVVILDSLNYIKGINQFVNQKKFRV